jgi:hypothetical protein
MIDVIKLWLDSAVGISVHSETTALLKGPLRTILREKTHFFLFPEKFKTELLNLPERAQFPF